MVATVLLRIEVRDDYTLLAGLGVLYGKFEQTIFGMGDDGNKAENDYAQRPNFKMMAHLKYLSESRGFLFNGGPSSSRTRCFRRYKNTFLAIARSFRYPGIEGTCAFLEGWSVEQNE